MSARAMKLALVTTPWDAPGDYAACTRALGRELWDHADVHVFVERGREGADWFGGAHAVGGRAAPARLRSGALPRRRHRRTRPSWRRWCARSAVVSRLHSWELRQLARAAYPELAKPGLRAAKRAFGEGGLTAAREHWSDPASTNSPLNRSIVRFGDTFLVRDEALRKQLLDDRNAPTPIGVLPWPATPEGDWAAVATAMFKLFERFPPPRTARRGLIGLRVREGLRQSSQKA
jgi:hypothetical protein